MRLGNVPVEVRFTAIMVAILLGLSLAYGLPIRMPTSGGGEFLGIHYLFPLIGLFVWAGCMMLTPSKYDIRPILIALPCYAIVLLVHFHIKLWAPLINPKNYDDLYWSIDQHYRPLVDASFTMRKGISGIISYKANLYMVGFVIMFYLSFCYHAVRTPNKFRELFLAILFAQGIGAIAYLAAPAVGPFIFEHGANPRITAQQDYMYAVHQQILHGGTHWLAGNETDFLLVGLGAMPSLHVGLSAIFLWFAFRNGRLLLVTYVPLFAFIVVNAIASRWHYLIDLPAGLALAALCLWLADRLVHSDALPNRSPANVAWPARDTGLVVTRWLSDATLRYARRRRLIPGTEGATALGEPEVSAMGDAA